MSAQCNICPQAPWYPYQLLLDRAIWLHALSTFVAFGAMFCCVVQLSWFLAAAPYHLSPAMIGIACLAQNAAGEEHCPLLGQQSASCSCQPLAL
jgi:hypothetical protein